MLIHGTYAASGGECDPERLKAAREGSSRKRRSRSHPWAFSDLEARRDEFRRSGDIFSAPRLGWHFKRVITRTVNPPRPGTRFVDAAKAQSESTFADIDGSLVGLFRNSACSARAMIRGAELDAHKRGVTPTQREFDGYAHRRGRAAAVWRSAVG